MAKRFDWNDQQSKFNVTEPNRTDVTRLITLNNEIFAKYERSIWKTSLNCRH